MNTKFETTETEEHPEDGKEEYDQTIQGTRRKTRRWNEEFVKENELGGIWQRRMEGLKDSKYVK
jgi:hypothetical protein